MGELERIPEKSNREVSLLTLGIMPEALLAVAFISPEREKAITTYIERIEERRRQKIADFEQEVLKSTKFSPEELLQRLLEDEAASSLFEQAVLQAVATAERRKLRALARAVASGLLADDKAVFDISSLHVRTIAALEPAHIRILLVIGHFRRSAAHSVFEEKCRWAGDALSPLERELRDRGLIQSETNDLSSEYADIGSQYAPRLTRFGAGLLEYLQDETNAE
jgi:hypothetical protein